MKQKILFVTPPMTQLNTPYPATAYLTGFLRQHGYDAVQADLSLELFLKVFSAEGLSQIPVGMENDSPTYPFFIQNRMRYLSVVDSVVRFLQGRDSTLAFRIVGREYLPEGPRFAALEQDAGDGQAWAFGSLGIQDRARYYASLMIDDLADLIQQSLDPRFGLSRYGEKLAASQATFDALESALESATPTLIDQFLDQLTVDMLHRFQPDVVGLSVPFPGNVYGAFRIARQIKKNFPSVTILLGGGYVNTELRDLCEPKVFQYVDWVTYDDGERPLLSLLEFLERGEGTPQLLRTRTLENQQVLYHSSPTLHDIPQKDTGIPTYDGLPLDRYVSLFEMLNPMHRLWSDGRWNKLTLAHGCYWKKCNFCDVTLDYIGRYDPSPTNLLVDRIEALVRETGVSGFHFVDEAAPPAVLKHLAQSLIDRNLSITWWANVRFDKTFTPELTQLLARSGCIAVSGGLEVASDRLLKLMQKGVTVEQVARVTQAFTNAGIMVHAYLMYGFPTQTVQETVDALERVRQLFEEGCLQSAFWHRFSATAHSPIGKNPEKFGIRLLPEAQEVRFARNDLEFEDPTQVDHDFLGEGLRKALYNYMQGVGFDLDPRAWFGTQKTTPTKNSKQKQTQKLQYRVPAPQVPQDLIQRALNSE